MPTTANCKGSSCRTYQVEDAVDKAAKEELVKDLDEQRSSQAQASTSSRAVPCGGPGKAAGEMLMQPTVLQPRPAGKTASASGPAGAQECCR